MQPATFAAVMRPIIDFVADRQINAALEDALNEEFPAASFDIAEIEQTCHAAIAAGWMCSEGSGARRFGRVTHPARQSRFFSVDVVDLTNAAGALHRHPAGEICLVMPADATALFEGRPRGWCVFEPGSSHQPAVTGGRALVLYLLPRGEIEFQE